ncbi:hypothetical protein FF38_09792 [Lucilia cuprina]|uniref:Kazal-like domain-containing protein n=1 Tax=Lucilia cuprina TaxID=7375 RepID=A0A0L0BR14_LUCCU|nr:hypothetical protein FF38_09792 [Lucilia cuprina]
MHFFGCCLILSFLSFSKAYTNYKSYPKDYLRNYPKAYPGDYPSDYKSDYPSDYCILGNTPVCATNGHEYFLLENECEFNNFNSKQLEKGQLDSCYTPASALSYEQHKYDNYCPQYCNRILKPLCASYRNEQRNFTNECVLKKHICETKENWQVILNDTCVSVSCALDGQEICASLNGYMQSFPNLFSLYGEIQTRGKDWQILNVGPCPCPEDYRPICAQLNCTARTFTNECFLEREVKNGSHWSILFFGECPELPTSTASPNNVDNNDDEVENSGDGPFDVDDAIAKSLNEECKPRQNKPVYIVKKNQISPYIPSLYPNKPLGKPHDYHHQNQPYNIAKSNKNTYEKLSKKTYDKYEKAHVPPKTSYNDHDADMFSNTIYNYAGHVNPPDYQSFFKPLNTPLTVSAVSLVSSGYNNDLYTAQTVTDIKYQNYNPVSITAYSPAPINSYGDINYNDEDLYDSLYESFT